jgi:hypothetical protein
MDRTDGSKLNRYNIYLLVQFAFLVQNQFIMITRNRKTYSLDGLILLEIFIKTVLEIVNDSWFMTMFCAISSWQEGTRSFFPSFTTIKRRISFANKNRWVVGSPDFRQPWLCEQLVEWKRKKRSKLRRTNCEQTVSFVDGNLLHSEFQHKRT